MDLKTVHETVRKIMNEKTGSERRALHTACVCIEKALPKRSLTETKTDGNAEHRCPLCKDRLTGAVRYCRNCGQRVRW